MVPPGDFYSRKPPSDPGQLTAVTAKLVQVMLLPAPAHSAVRLSTKTPDVFTTMAAPLLTIRQTEAAVAVEEN